MAISNILLCKAGIKHVADDSTTINDQRHEVTIEKSKADNSTTTNTAG